MSELVPYERPDEENLYEMDMEVYHLADMLEGYAQTYSDDYADEIDDGVEITRGTTELGGTLSSTVTFQANRIRGTVFSAGPGAVELGIYNLRSTVTQEGLIYDALPTCVKDYVQNFEDFAYDYDDSTLVSLVYEQNYFVTTDGEFNFHYSLALHLDDDALLLPDTGAELGLNDSVDENEMPDLDEAQQNNYDLLAEVFGAEEVLGLRALANQIVDEHANIDALYNFYERMEDQRYLTRSARIHLAQNILRQLFVTETA